jgi:hypothetical protein
MGDIFNINEVTDNSREKIIKMGVPTEFIDVLIIMTKEFTSQAYVNGHNTGFKEGVKFAERMTNESK